LQAWRYLLAVGAEVAARLDALGRRELVWIVPNQRSQSLLAGFLPAIPVFQVFRYWLAAGCE
jgi:hypothetical protein